MKYTRLSALALCGALALSLAACSPKEPAVSQEPTPTPEESSLPSGQPSPTPGQGAATADGKVDAAWAAIADAVELPSLVEVDDDLLSSLYYLDAALLDEYVARMPAMNVHATEFFLARVKEGNMDAVKAAVEKRQADLVAQWSQYLPEQLALVEDYRLVESGDYLLFCVCEDADAVVAAFEAAVAGSGESAAVLVPTPVVGTPAPAPTQVGNQPDVPPTAPVQTPAQESQSAQPTAQSVYEAVAAAGGLSGFVDTSFALDAYYNLTAEDLADYALYQPDMSTDAQEIFVARAAQGKLDTVKAACQGRQQAMEEETQFYTGTGSYMDSCQLLTQGDWVLFYVGPQADSAAGAFQSAAK